MKHGGRIFLTIAVATLTATSCGGSSESSSTAASSDPLSAQEIQDLADSGMVEEIADAAGVPQACLELSLAMATASGGMVPGSDETGIDSDALAQSFDAIRDMAPGDLQGDVEIVKEGMTEYLEVLAEFGNDFTAMMADPAALERFSSVFDDETFSEATDRFSVWLETVCNP